MDSEGTINQLKQDVMAALSADPVLGKLDIYESEGYINPKIRLPAMAIQRMDRRRADLRDQSAGFKTYAMPLRITIYTKPAGKSRILPELYMYEERVESVLENAYHDGTLSDVIDQMRFVVSRETTIYDMKKEKIFSNTIIMEYEFTYEVLI